tara:strand:- start:645 stop:857 length:213 start_codon:yes stop_codon:yes gene_type:complete
MKTLSNKLNQVKRIIKNLEDNYSTKKESVMWTIWNNFYDLEKQLVESIRISKVSYNNSSASRDLISLNID